MQTTVRERLLSFIKYKQISVRSFERASKVSYGYVNNIRVSIQPDKIMSIASQFPDLNISWLLTGEGEMLKNKEDSATAVVTANVMNVPLVSKYAHAGYLSEFGDDEYIEALPTIPFIVEHEGRGSYLCFEVKGDSMDDGSINSYTEGEILLCREITSDLWCNSKLHVRNWDFVIVHKTDGILIKEIIEHDNKNHTITIHSRNNFYEDVVLKLKDIQKIFNVISSQRLRKR